MGGPMAGHLVAAGHQVAVWNRTPEKSEPLREKGATVAHSLQELGSLCDVIFLCVGKTEDVIECASKLADNVDHPLFIIDHSTIEPKGAVFVAHKLASEGHRFVDAPVTGGSLGAQKGTLTIFCGGSESDVAELQPLLVAYGKNVRRVGDVGAGQTAKLANQIAVGGALMALCESLAFAQKAGLDLAQMREMIGGGAGGSWAFENYGPKLLARDWTPGFSIKNQRKDFAYCISAADSIGASIPSTVLVDKLLGIMDAEGKSELTTSVLFELYERGEFSG